MWWRQTLLLMKPAALGSSLYFLYLNEFLFMFCTIFVNTFWNFFADFMPKMSLDFVFSEKKQYPLGCTEFASWELLGNLFSKLRWPVIRFRIRTKNTKKLESPPQRPDWYKICTRFCHKGMASFCHEWMASFCHEWLASFCHESDVQ